MDHCEDEFDRIRSVVLRRSETSGIGLGFSIMGGAGFDFPPVIYGIEKDSPAARSGVLEAGDIILGINEREVVKLSTKEVLKCLRLSGDIVHIKYKRDPHVVSRVRKFLSMPASHYMQSSDEIVSTTNSVHTPKPKGSEPWQIDSHIIEHHKFNQKDINPSNISTFSEDVFINHSHHGQPQQAKAKVSQSNNPFSNSVEKNGRKNFETFVMTGEAILNLTRSDGNDSYHSPTKTTSKLTPMSPSSQHVVIEKKRTVEIHESTKMELFSNSISVEENSPPLPPPPMSNTSSKSEKNDTKSGSLPPPPMLEYEDDSDKLGPDVNGVDKASVKDCAVLEENGNNNEDTSISSSVMSDSEEALNDDDLDADPDADDQELLIGSSNEVQDKNKIVLKVTAKAKNEASGTRDTTRVSEKERYPEYLLLGKGSPNISEDEDNSTSESLSPDRRQFKNRLQKFSSQTSRESEESEEDEHELDDLSEFGPTGAGRITNGSGGESDSSDVESVRVAPVVKAVDLPSAERLAKRLFTLDGFRVTDVWRQLCKCNEFSRAVASEYLKFFDFRDQTLDVSLRKFLSVCPLRGETSERERVLEHFSVRYVECNPGILGSSDSVHTLTCALMLLNTDIYSDVKARRPMSCADFIKNLNGLNDGRDFSKEILKQLYHSIKSKPLVSPGDAEDEEDSNREVLQQTELPATVRSQEYKRGYLRRKSIFEAGGKKTPLGKRSWKMVYCRLKELVLMFSHDEQAKPSSSKSQVLKTHHCYATVATEYQKRPHVFKLILADKSQYLFQSSDPREMSSWIDILNWNAGRFSAPALDPPVSSSRKFERPLLLSSVTRLSAREQLMANQNTLAKYEEERNQWSHLLQDPKGTTSFQKKEIKERLMFYLFEIQRYKVYVEEMEKRIAEEVEAHAAQHEIVELQVLPNPPSVLLEEADECNSS